MNWIKKIIKVRSEPWKFCWWRGGDAIKLVMMPPEKILNKLRILNYRLFWRIAHKRFNEHWVNNEPLKQALLDFGISENKIKVKPIEYPKVKIKKMKHNKFTVLFYLPKGRKYKLFTSWIYGKEYIYFLQEYYNVFLVDGSYNMYEVYPIIDCYVKINKTKYNGLNWIGKQCIDNDIPVFIVNDFNDTFENNIKRLDKWINTKKDIWNTKKEKK